MVVRLPVAALAVAVLGCAVGGCAGVREAREVREGDLLVSGYLFLPEEGRPTLSPADEVLIPEPEGFGYRSAPPPWGGNPFGGAKLGQYPFVQARAAGEVVGIDEPERYPSNRNIAVFWEIEADGAGGGRYRFLYLVRGGPGGFLFAARPQTQEADRPDRITFDSNRPGRVRHRFHISAVFVERETILSDAHRLGSLAIWRDFNAKEPEPRALPATLPSIPASLLEGEEPWEACRSIAAGVALTIASDLAVLSGEAERLGLPDPPGAGE